MKVVLLMGSSSVGKSTLCDELVKNHGWKTVSLDDAILLMERKTGLIELKPELSEQVRLSGLRAIMTEKEILTLCTKGILNISGGTHTVTNQRLSLPNLPGVENILKASGFEPDKIDSLANNLRKVAVCGLDMPVYMMYDQVFSTENESEQVIVDIFPLPGGVLPVLQDFQERAKSFQNQNPDITLTTHTALAYCPPQFLSARIEERNQRAVSSGNLNNQRKGLFPFEQLSTLITAAHQSDFSSTAYTIKEDDLFDIVKKHTQSTAEQAVYLETAFDPDVQEDPIVDPLEMIDVEHGRVTVRDLDEPQMSIQEQTAHLRIGTSEQIRQYQQLKTNFDFSGYKEAALSIRHKEAYDVFIDTSKNDASTLASNFVREIQELSTEQNSSYNQP